MLILKIGRQAASLVLYSLLLLFACGNSTGNGPDNGNQTDMGDGYKLYNIVPDFIGYAEKGGSQGEEQRNALWDSMLEAKYEDFFRQVIYRNKTGNDMEQYKASIIGTFRSDIVPNRLTGLKSMHSKAVRQILDGRSLFKKKFTDFNPQCDFYLTVSFSFNGKAVELNGKTVFAVGLENFGPDGPQLDFTIAHELYHLYHFSKNFSPSGSLYRAIWAEGMATYAQIVFYPGNYTYSQYLNFTGSRTDEIVNKFEMLKSDVITNIYSNDEAVKRAYLGMEDNSLGIPPGAGYYIGLRIVMKLIEEGFTFEAMTLWDADKAAVEMVRVLPGLTAN